MRKLLREPFLHFVLLGGGLFLVFAWTGEHPGEELPGDDRIVVTEGRLDQLATRFTKTWQRPPTRQELEGLIDDFVLEEIYYRRASEMGLGHDDSVIRLRLRQKMEFLTDDMAALVEPSDDELAQYLEDNPDKFRREATFSFRQVYLNPAKHGDDLARRASTHLISLREGGEVGGDPTLLPAQMGNAETGVIDRTFGDGFAARLATLRAGSWDGPVDSSYGTHLIYMEDHLPGRIPPLDEIREVVAREWANDKRLAMRREINHQLRQQYEVAVEWPEDSP